MTTAVRPGGALSSSTLSSGVRRAVDVVLVEDDADSRFLIEHMLIAAGCRVRAFASPTPALVALRLRTPNVVVTDLLFSDDSGGGLALATALRADPRTADVALIVVTGMAAPAPDMLARFDAYFCKPVDVSELRETVWRLGARELGRASRNGTWAK